MKKLWNRLSGIMASADWGGNRAAMRTAVAVRAVDLRLARTRPLALRPSFKTVSDRITPIRFQNGFSSLRHRYGRIAIHPDAHTPFRFPAGEGHAHHFWFIFHGDGLGTIDSTN